jgi:IS1 family transposase
MTGVHKTTILKLIADLGRACQDFHNDRVRGLSCSRVQCDETWAFCYSKEKNVPEDKRGYFGYGDVWTWTAIDADSKLMIAWHVGLRDAGHAIRLMNDVADRVVNRIQLTTDGLRAYLVAVDYAFGNNIDYAQLVKLYGPDRTTATRYSPPLLTAVEKKVRCGNPSPEYVNTSYVERSNLTLRMGMRRATRLTNAFSKKVSNHKHMTAIFWTYYNFCRVHSTIKTSPAVKAGLIEKPWTMEDLIGLLDISAAV